MSELFLTDSSRHPHTVSSTMPEQTNKPPQSAHTPKPKPKWTEVYLQIFLKHLREEYWAYIALFGLSALYAGIMISVFGFTKILNTGNGQIEWFGVFLILCGVALLLASGILYHRKIRRLRPCICCGVDMDDTVELPVRNKKRLRFAPNLISPYYDQTNGERPNSSTLSTTVEDILQETEMAGIDDLRRENTEEIKTSLINRGTYAAKITKC